MHAEVVYVVYSHTMPSSLKQNQSQSMSCEERWSQIWMDNHFGFSPFYDFPGFQRERDEPNM